MSGCVEPDVLVAFASGRLSGEALETVEGHLDSCASCRAAAAAVAGMDSTSGTAVTAPRREGSGGLLPKGTLVGRYEVLEVAGSGGMGVIYRALDPTLNRIVALKLVRPDRSHGDAAQRLLFEAKAMARVVHPEVLPVYDAGTFGEQLFIAMEWVEGATLRSALEAKPGPWRERLGLVLRAGRGLAAAHRAGLVHRDFKPENVLLGADGRLRVGDFGLAHDAADSEVPAGTAAYMAPEVLKGQPATAAADQYAFCVVLHEALCGQRPAAGSSAALPGPPALSRAVLRGLAEAPADRHASMDALVAQLERIARPRTAVWAAAIAAPVLLRAAGLGAFGRTEAQPCASGPERVAAVWNPNRKAELQAAAPQPDAAKAARVSELLDVFAGRWSDAHRRACEATHVAGEQSEQLLDLKMACLQQKLGSVDALLLALQHDPRAFAKSVEAAEEAVAIGRCADAAFLTAGGGAKLTADQRAAVASLREAMGKTRQLLVLGSWELGRPKAEEHVRKAEALGVKAVEGEAHLLLAELLRKLRTKTSQGEELDGRLDAAILAGTEAQYPHLLAEAWLVRMRVCTDDTRFDEAERSERNLAANLRAIGGDPWLQARHDQSLGLLRFRQSRLDDALAAYDSAKLQLERLPAEEQRLLSSDLWGSLALVQLTAGDFAHGVEALERAIAGTEERFGPEHVKLGDLLHNLCEAELTRGDVGTAKLHCERAGKVWAAAYGADNPRVAVNLNLAALVLSAGGRHDEALAAVAEAKRIFTLHHLETQFVFMRSLCSEGEVQAAQGNAAAAIAALNAALALAPNAAGKYPLDEAGCRRALGEVLLREGKAAEARAQLEAAIALYGQTRSAGPWLARARVALAELDLNEGHADVARQSLEEALAALESQQLDPKLQARAKSILARAK